MIDFRAFSARYAEVFKTRPLASNYPEYPKNASSYANFDEIVRRYQQGQEEYREKCKVYRAKMDAFMEEFKDAVFKELGLEGLGPIADIAFNEVYYEPQNAAHAASALVDILEKCEKNEILNLLKTRYMLR